MSRIWLLFVLVVSLLIIRCGNEDKGAGSNRPAAPEDTTAAKPKTETKTILFFGNSLSAGYGVDPSEAFPALIQRKIDSANLAYKVINGGVSGETTAGGNQRIDFVLKQQPVDVFVLELGGNDGLRGLPLTKSRKNLQSIIDKVIARYPDAELVLAGMQIPPNMGQAYANEFSTMYPELAKENNMTLIPFLLEGVGGEAILNQQDGIHPTPEGHQIIAETIWQHLKPVLD